MHPNPIYRAEGVERNLGFARHLGFGTLALDGGVAGPLLSHIPFRLSEDGSEVEFHLVRSNPIARALTAGARPAVIAVVGPHGYVSPDWYGIENQVPTWNYVAVHLRGSVELLPPERLRAVLDRLSAVNEARLLPKEPWLTDKVEPEALGKMMRMIVPARMQVATVEGTWKLSQNKSPAAIEGAARGLDQSGNGSEPSAVAALMRGTGPF